MVNDCDDAAAADGNGQSLCNPIFMLVNIGQPPCKPWQKILVRETLRGKNCFQDT